LKLKERNRNLYIFLVFVLLSSGGGAFFLFKNAPQNEEKIIVPLSTEEEYFIPLKIHGYDSANVPYLDVVIGDMTIPSIIDLGFTGTFSLPSHFIKDIAEKEWIKQIQVYGVRGRAHERDVYEVKNMRIQGLTLAPVWIEEKGLEDINEGIIKGTVDPQKDYIGTIGRELFENSNLLIDCRYSMLALCDSLETLKQRGYPIEFFTETPMITNSNFIAFEALTEEGPVSCILDTGCTFNLLNKDLENEFNDHRILTAFSTDNLSLLNPENKDLLIYDPKDRQELSSFKIGRKDFGPLTFHRMKSPFNIDVILGMEFFNLNLIFVDFENKKVYLFPQKDEGGVTIGAGHERKN
jgi:hypothetical protein